ncbi:MAG: hypothetical protein ACLT90_03495 [Enterococcus raffinosus]
MGYEDEDFIVRQAKQMGELLGGIIGKKMLMRFSRLGRRPERLS